MRASTVRCRFLDRRGDIWVSNRADNATKLNCYHQMSSINIDMTIDDMPTCGARRRALRCHQIYGEY